MEIANFLPDLLMCVFSLFQLKLCYLPCPSTIIQISSVNNKDYYNYVPVQDNLIYRSKYLI